MDDSRLEYLADCIGRLEDAQGIMAGRLDRGDRRFVEIQTELSSNTKITQEVKELLDSGRAGLRVLGWIGVLAKWAAGVAAAGLTLWAAYSAVKSGKPPTL